MAEANDREQRILDAAAELFVHYGYGKTTVDDIASRAGISKGAVYLHFRSKDELLDRLIERESVRLMDDIIARLERDPEGVTLFNLYRHSMLAIKANPVLLALYNRDRRVLGEYHRRVRELPLFQQATTIGVEFVERFQRAGLIKPDVKPEVLANILLAIRYGILNIEDAAPDLASTPIEEVGKVIGDMLQTAFGTDGGDKEEGKKALLELFEMGRQFLQQMRERK